MKAIPLVLLMQLLLSIVSCYMPKNKTKNKNKKTAPLMFSNWVQLEKKILLDVFFFLIMGLFWPPLLLIPSRTFQFRVMQLFLLGNERKRAIGVSDRNALWKRNTVARKSWLVRECIRHPNYSSYKTLPISSVMVPGGLLVNESKTSPMYCNFLSKSVVLERYTGEMLLRYIKLHQND